MSRKLLALVCALSVVFLAACSGSKPADTKSAAPAAKAEEPVTITFWHTYNTDSNENKMLTETVIPAFQKKYPNITVKSVVQPYDGLHDSLVTAAASGTAPDVMRMDIIWTPEFAKLQALEALDAYPGFGDLKKAVFPGPLATNVYKGKTYGLPLDTNTQVLVYNNDLLKQAGLTAAPKNADELIKYMSAFKGKDGQYGVALNSASTWQLLPFFWTLGGKLTNDDYSKATGFLNGDASVKAVSTLYDWYKQGLLAPTMTGGQPDTWTGFKGGKYGAILEGPWAFPSLLNDMKDKMKGGVIPTGVAGSISVVGGENVVMFKSSKNKEAAWKFIQYMLSDEYQTAMAKTGQMPVTESASTSAVMKETAYYADFVTQLKTAMPRTPVPAWSKIDKILGDTFEAIFRGQAQVKPALDKAAADIDALLGQ
jgi:multiple sugar transport system substrate-binding protein